MTNTTNIEQQPKLAKVSASNMQKEVEMQKALKKVASEMGYYGGPFQRTNKKFRKTYCDASGRVDYNKLPTQAPASAESHPMVYEAFMLKCRIDEHNQQRRKGATATTSLDAKPSLMNRMKSSFANAIKKKVKA